MGHWHDQCVWEWTATNLVAFVRFDLIVVVPLLLIRLGIALVDSHVGVRLIRHVYGGSRGQIAVESAVVEAPNEGRQSSGPSCERRTARIFICQAAFFLGHFFDSTGAVVPPISNSALPLSPHPSSMPVAQYQRLPSSPRDEDREASARAPSPKRPIDPRFDRPPPAAWKRIALILFLAFLFWLSYAIRPTKQSAKPEVIYASRCVWNYLRFVPQNYPLVYACVWGGVLGIQRSSSTGRLRVLLSPSGSRTGG